MGILAVITSIEFPQCVAIKDHFLYIYKKIAECSRRKQTFLFTLPRPLATSALGKLYLRKTRISRFVWAKRINGNLSWVLETLSPLVVSACGPKDSATCEKTSGTQGKRKKLYLLNRLSRGRHFDQRRHLTKYCIIHSFYLYREELRFKLLHFS